MADVADVAGGIIPAYAGSTPPSRCAWYSSRDHPRIRGEHAYEDGGDTLMQGSSPHTRGAPLLDGSEPTDYGIIPAYAGSTRTARGAVHGVGDHPRIRGEHSYDVGEVCAWQGSSPHTRGALHARARDRRVPGIIPAYAGSTVIYLLAYQIICALSFTIFE